jgi:hypothetical protein
MHKVGLTTAPSGIMMIVKAQHFSNRIIPWLHNVKSLQPQQFLSLGPLWQTTRGEGLLMDS